MALSKFEQCDMPLKETTDQESKENEVIKRESSITWN